MNAKLQLFTLVVGGVIACVGVFLSIKPEEDGTALEDFALGKQTTTVLSERDGRPVHVVKLRERSVLAEVDIPDGMQKVLWLGNSQLHAINQAQPDDENSAALLHDLALSHGYYLQAMSFPNANLQEHLVAFAAMLDSHIPDVLLLPAVFDDTREDGLRPEIARELNASADTQKRLSDTEIGARIVKENLPDEEVAATNEPGFVTLQERTEEYLETTLSENTKFWNTRSELRGQISLGTYRLRNRVLGINAQSIRKKIPARYKRNLDALKAMLEISKSNDIEVLLYIAPLRNDVKPPYDENEYQAFKEDCQGLAEQVGVAFLDAENVVDDGFWGTKRSTNGTGKPEYDFMHFQMSGHKQLAEELDLAIQDLRKRE